MTVIDLYISTGFVYFKYRMVLHMRNYLSLNYLMVIKYYYSITFLYEKISNKKIQRVYDINIGEKISVIRFVSMLKFAPYASS